MANKTEVFVRDYTVQARIGVYDHEKNRKQPLRISCSCTLALPGTWNSDRIEDTFSYEHIVNEIEHLADQRHIDLVEVFAEKLASFCLQSPQINEVTVTVEKPAVFPAGVVGAKITRVRA